MENAAQAKAQKSMTETLVKQDTHIQLGAVRTQYGPVTDEKKKLDRQINFKLDLCVIVILVINFLLQG
jgi:hypothetical protein